MNFSMGYLDTVLSEVSKKSVYLWFHHSVCVKQLINKYSTDKRHFQGECMYSSSCISFVLMN